MTHVLGRALVGIGPVATERVIRPLPVVGVQPDGCQSGSQTIDRRIARPILRTLSQLLNKLTECCRFTAVCAISLALTWASRLRWLLLSARLAVFSTLRAISLVASP